MLQHTVAGAGSLLFERRRHRLLPGDTMLLVIPGNHRYWLAPGDTWEHFWLSTRGEEAVAVQRDVQAAVGPVFRLQDGTLERIAVCCLALIEGGDRRPGALSATTYQALMALYDDVLFRPPAAHTGEWTAAPASPATSAPTSRSRST